MRRLFCENQTVLAAPAANPQSSFSAEHYGVVLEKGEEAPALGHVHLSSAIISRPDFARYILLGETVRQIAFFRAKPKVQKGEQVPQG